MSFINVDKISYKYPSFSDSDGDGFSFEDDSAKKEKDHNASDDIYAVRDVRLDVNAGDFICILGSNGSGKSTLARHLNALLLPSEGTVWIDGMNSADESKIWDIRAMVGMVFQNPDNQIIGSSVDEDVAFGLENLGVPSEQIQKKVEEVLKLTGLSDLAKSSPMKLSGGQKQRSAIAGVLAMEPKCIVLDECTAMLDPRGRQQIMDWVKLLNKKLNITIICITHFMEEALAADKIFVMNKGSLVMSGSPVDIFSRGREIGQFGLRLPAACELTELLRQKGMDIPENVIDACSLKDFLLTKTKEK